VNADLNDRIAREKELYDRGIHLGQKYMLLLSALNQGPAMAKSRQITHGIMAQCHGKDVLEIGSEAWTSWMDFQKYPPKSLTAINISEAELLKGKQAVTKLKPPINIDFRIMDAHSLDFPNDSFDFVYGASILHHLDIDLAIGEIHRVLKPGGIILFLEPLIYNPIAKIVRYLTPGARTPDEKPLGSRELKVIDQYFSTHNYYFQLIEPFFTLMSAFLTKNSDNVLTNFANNLDQVIAQLPYFKYFYRNLLINGIKI
jgi:SAM-dependent methyltransferase